MYALQWVQSLNWKRVEARVMKWHTTQRHTPGFYFNPASQLLPLPFSFCIFLSSFFLFSCLQKPYRSQGIARVWWFWLERQKRGVVSIQTLRICSHPPFQQASHVNYGEDTHAQTYIHSQLILCQNRAPKNCCQVATAQGTAEFLALGRIDGCGQEIIAELTCVERSGLRC